MRLPTFHSVYIENSKNGYANCTSFQRRTSQQSVVRVPVTTRPIKRRAARARDQGNSPCCEFFNIKEKE